MKLHNILLICLLISSFTYPIVETRQQIIDNTRPEARMAVKLVNFMPTLIIQNINRTKTVITNKIAGFVMPENRLSLSRLSILLSGCFFCGCTIGRLLVCLLSEG